MNIAYSCDEAYIHHTGISILSLLENNKEFKEINIYFIEKNVSKKSIASIEKLIYSYQRSLICIPFHELCSELKINALGRHIETVYSKLFFSGIPNIDKILYIDSDTIINDSLIDFWNIDLEENLVAGVETYSVEAKPKLNLNKKDRFINDGIVLINLKEFRKQNIKQKFINCINSYHGNPPVLSEGVINKVCKNRIKVIHPKYNLMSGLITYKHNPFLDLDKFYKKKCIHEAIKKPVIIHYLSGFYNRPWDVNCTHPMKEKYLYYKSISYWKDIPLQNKKMNLRLRTIKFLYQYIPNISLEYIRFLIKKMK